MVSQPCSVLVFKSSCCILFCFCNAGKYASMFSRKTWYTYLYKNVQASKDGSSTVVYACVFSTVCVYCFVVLLFSLAVVSCTLFLASTPVAPPPNYVSNLGCLYTVFTLSCLAPRLERLRNSASLLSYYAAAFRFVVLLPTFSRCFIFWNAVHTCGVLPQRKKKRHDSAWSIRNRFEAELVNSELRDAPSTAWES